MGVRPVRDQPKRPDDLKRQIARLAATAGKAPPVCLVEALSREADRAELRARFAINAAESEREAVAGGKTASLRVGLWLPRSPNLPARWYSEPRRRGFHMRWSGRNRVQRAGRRVLFGAGGILLRRSGRYWRELPGDLHAPR